MRELGLSLVELLVAIAIGAFIALAGTTYFATTFGAGETVEGIDTARVVLALLSQIENAESYCGD